MNHLLLPFKQIIYLWIEIKEFNLISKVCTNLTSGMIYFGTDQYQCTVSDLLLFFILYCIYIYIYIIKIKVYHKTLP